MDDMTKLSIARQPPAQTYMCIMTPDGITHHARIWMGVTTTTAGEWTIDYSSAGFTKAPMVFPMIQLSDADVYDRGMASLSTAPTPTSAAGYGLRGANLLALGSTIRTVPDGTTVHVIALGA